MSRPSPRRRSLGATVLTLALVLTACTSGNGTDEPDGDGAVDQPAPSAPVDGGAAGGSELTGFDVQLRMAIEDAAASAGVTAEEVALVEGRGVTWTDGSLGCPQPDMMYTQALVEGYRFVLEVAGERITYHGATGQDPFRCEDPAEGGFVD
jgi:hypothetical protein